MPRPVSPLLISVAASAAVLCTAFYSVPEPETLSEVLDADYRVNEFERIVENSTLKEDLADETWEYTVVVPTDEAFDKQGATDAKPLANISALDYVVPTSVSPHDVKFGEAVRVPSLGGQELVFSRVTDTDEGLRVNGQPVQTIHRADNGVVYLINEMLVFPDKEQQYSLAR